MSLMDYWSLLSIGPGWGDELVYGFVVTITLSVLTYIFGSCLGLACALLELYGSRSISIAFASYSAMMRSIPELLTITLVYFGGPVVFQSALLIVGIKANVGIDPFGAGLVALSLVQGAYSSEVMRGAINAVPSGYYEAGLSLGLKRHQVFLLVTAPTALRYAFPGLANLWMTVIKNTPLVSAIGLSDLVGAASTAGQNTKHYFVFYGAVIAAYLFLSGASMAGQYWLEQRIFMANRPRITW